MSFECPVSWVTHLIISTVCTSRLNEHVEAIEQQISQILHTSYSCLFTYDILSTPQFFVPHTTEEKNARAMDILRASGVTALGDGICFEMCAGHGIACFDVIDVLCTFAHCSIYSNVSHLSVIEHEGNTILVLRYDAADN